MKEPPQKHDYSVGMVFIAPVDDALRIRTGERGESTLPK